MCYTVGDDERKFIDIWHLVGALIEQEIQKPGPRLIWNGHFCGKIIDLVIGLDFLRFKSVLASFLYISSYLLVERSTSTQVLRISTLLDLKTSLSRSDVPFTVDTKIKRLSVFVLKICEVWFSWTRILEATPSTSKYEIKLTRFNTNWRLLRQLHSPPSPSMTRVTPVLHMTMH